MVRGSVKPGLGYGSATKIWTRKTKAGQIEVAQQTRRHRSLVAQRKKIKTVEERSWCRRSERGKKKNNE
jgi:hypothetical protein